MTKLRYWLGGLTKTIEIGKFERNEYGRTLSGKGISIRLFPWPAERTQNIIAIGYNRKHKRLNLPFISIWFY